MFDANVEMVEYKTNDVKQWQRQVTIVEKEI